MKNHFSVLLTIGVCFCGLSLFANMSEPVNDTHPQGYVLIADSAFYMPELNRYRRIWVWLPPDYYNTENHYPVLYMHDGQNLFDPHTSFAGEWEVDEALDSLSAAGKVVPIVVGIDNGANHRIAEYTPWVNANYGGGEGVAYAAFVAETLKPWVDENFRTLPTREHTAVMGSSLGGLISFYMALQYPEVFSKAGIFSPSFWFSDSVFDFATTRANTLPVKFYFMGGDKESESLVPLMHKMVDTLGAAGRGKHEIRLEIIAGGSHNEQLWREQFAPAVEWLFSQEEK